MNTYEAIETAIEAAREAQRAILEIEATQFNRSSLDASYNALKATIENLSKLLYPTNSR